MIPKQLTTFSDTSQAPRAPRTTEWGAHVAPHSPLYFLHKTTYNSSDMKSSIHPTHYRPVVFSDEAAGFAFLTQSTAQTNDTIKWEDGNEYPLVKVHISSASHPFFTGEEKIIDTEGRVDRFKAKFAAAEARKAQLAAKAKKLNAQKSKKATSSEK